MFIILALIVVIIALALVFGGHHDKAPVKGLGRVPASVGQSAVIL
jgi:hypothetical protein